MGHQDTVMFIPDHYDTMVRPQRVVAINMTFRRRRDGKQWLKHLLLTGQMRTNIINPSLDGRLGNGNKKERGKDHRKVPETDAAHHRGYRSRHQWAVDMLEQNGAALPHAWIAGSLASASALCWQSLRTR
jgi:hypothetical protein